jgi:site-specific DNA-methyltransferase (adenine-specific)
VSVTIRHGDMLEVLPSLPADTFHAVVTDPPYHLTTGKKGGSGLASHNPNSPAGRSRIGTGFMGKAWDGGNIAFRPETWAEVLRVMKPGAHLLAFGGSRTSHRMACAIEDAGFELRDTMLWLYGQGFPKTPDVLKPAYEPIILARKALIGTVAENRRVHGTGGLNIDACPVGDFVNTTPSGVDRRNAALADAGYRPGSYQMGPTTPSGSAGRWPANVLHDGSDEVLATFPAQSSVTGKRSARSKSAIVAETSWLSDNHESAEYTDSGSPARFFYCAKASKADRAGSKHPTIKPGALMRYLVRLVTPPGGHVLDCFAGSGTTGAACTAEGFDATLVEREAEYVADIQRRMGQASGADAPLFAGATP